MQVMMVGVLRTLGEFPRHLAGIVQVICARWWLVSGTNFQVR